MIYFLISFCGQFLLWSAVCYAALSVYLHSKYKKLKVDRETTDQRLSIINDLFYPVKFLVAWLLLCCQKRIAVRKKSVISDKFWLAVRPSELETSVDQPQDLFAMGDLKKACDELVFQGSDFQGKHNLLLRFARLGAGQAEVWLILRIFDQSTEKYLTLLHPDHPRTRLQGNSVNCWEGSGLCLRPREAMRKWFISYNGWMRIEESNRVVPVRFSFMWTALSNVIDFKLDFDCRLFAECLSAEKWSLNFLRQLFRIWYNQNCYEQWGEMKGIVKVDDDDGNNDFQLTIRGFRRHFYGQKDISGLHSRSITCTGYTEHGTFFRVSGVEIPNVAKNVLCGYVGLCTGDMFPITQSSLNFNLYNQLQSASHKYTISFDAGGQNYIFDGLSVCDEVVYGGEELEWKSCLQFTDICLNGIAGHGFSQFSRHAASPPPQDLLLPQRHVYMQIEDIGLEGLLEFERQMFCYSLNHRAARCETLSGGKARQLAQLISLQNEFSVPSGLCVSSNAYLLFIKENKDVQKLISALVSAVRRCCADDHLASACELIRTHMQSSQIPGVVVENIKQQLLLLFGDFVDQKRFAVRSSALGEDSRDSSSAGQMETILGVVGTEKILKAILQCWCSQFTCQAVEYRRQMCQRIDSVCAVVVQEMVASETSGVLFTCDPVTLSLKRVVINANFGLGESVVSGQTEPDQIEVTRLWPDKLADIRKRIGSKNVRIDMDDDGVMTVDNRNLSEKCSMNDDQIYKLAIVAVQLEKVFGMPCDIEWAYNNGTLFLLQLRPITTFQKETDFNLMHEFDSATRSAVEYNTRGNVGEVMGGVITPLGISIAAFYVDKSLQYRIYLNCGIQSLLPHLFHTCSIYANQVMLNLSQNLYRDANAIKNRKIWEICICGRPIEDAQLDKILQDDADSASRLRRIKNTVLTLKSILFESKAYKAACEKKYANFSLSAHSPSAKALYSAIEECFAAYFDVWLCHISNSAYSAFWYHTIMSSLVSKDQEWDAQIYKDVSLIYSSCNQVVSADVPHALQQLCDSIVQSDSADSFVQMSPKEGVDWLSSGPIKGLFAEFLKQHGHRCIHEIDFYENSWSEQPENLVPILQNMVRSFGAKPREQKTVLQPEEAVSQLSKKLNWMQRKLLCWAIPKARDAVGSREQSKGLLPDDDLLYYLTHNEIGQLLDSQQPVVLVSRAKGRRRVKSKQAHIRLPEISIGEPKPIETDQILLDPSALFLTGTPVSGGRVKALVRVASNIDEARHITSGDILVAYSTDIAWSVYFPLLSGVVTELGGLLSHGAVVAREYGLPCLVSVRGATAFFKSGDEVVLDADKGIISKVSPAAPQQPSPPSLATVCQPINT